MKKPAKAKKTTKKSKLSKADLEKVVGGKSGGKGLADGDFYTAVVTQERASAA